MSVLHVFRGLPGSGKSTAARKLAAEIGAILIEPDALLVQDGKYQYTPNDYRIAVFVTGWVLRVLAEWSGCDVIYADVLPKLEDVWRIDGIVRAYIPNIARFVHDLKITAEESKLRNRHNVNPADIDRMAKEWEDWKE